MLTKVFVFPEDYTTQQLRRDLEQRFKVQVKPHTSITCSYFDTFDWRIYHAGLVFYQMGDEYNLRRLNHTRIIARSTKQHELRFSSELPDGLLKDKLAPILGVRALMVTARAKIEEQHWQVLNEDGKIVVRLVFQRMFRMGRSDTVSLSTFGILQPLRGYQAEARYAAELLRASALKESPGDPYLILLQALHKQPGDYSARLNFHFQPEMSAAQVLGTVLQFLQQVAHRNIEGIIKDIDTEFLHDFRVAIRRARSAVIQLAEILPPQVLKDFKKELTYLGKQSNRLRDLDVYILKEEEYRQLLPEEMYRDMEPLFRQLREKRKKAHKKLVNILQEQRSRQILQDWQRLSVSLLREEQVTQRGHLAAVQVIKPIIARQMEQLLNNGRQIDSTSSAELLHKLRIECKKLRYLLEFFVSLFPGKPVNAMVKQLKALQDYLGDFNDLAVQQQFLLDFMEQLPGDDPQLRGTCAAVGALIGKLNERQQVLRREFERRFREFDSAKNRRLMERFFSM